MDYSGPWRGELLAILVFQAEDRREDFIIEYLGLEPFFSKLEEGYFFSFSHAQFGKSRIRYRGGYGEYQYFGLTICVPLEVDEEELYDSIMPHVDGDLRQMFIVDGYDHWHQNCTEKEHFERFDAEPPSTAKYERIVARLFRYNTDANPGKLRIHLKTDTYCLGAWRGLHRHDLFPDFDAFDSSFIEDVAIIKDLGSHLMIGFDGPLSKISSSDGRAFQKLVQQHLSSLIFVTDSV